MKTYAAAVWYGLSACKIGYERLANVSLALDDLSSVSDRVTGGNNLSGQAAVNNPQWVAAMQARTFHAMRVMSAIYRHLQVMGWMELITFVQNQTNPDEKLIAYTIIAVPFNRWVDEVAAFVGVAAKQEWKLDLSSNVVVSNIQQQIDRIPDIVAVLPLSPGYRPPVNRSAGSSDTELGVQALDTYGTSALGAFTKEFLDIRSLSNSFSSIRNIEANIAITANYFTNLSKLDVLKPLILGSGPGLNNVQSAVVNLASAALNEIPGDAGAAASCALRLGAGAYQTVALGLAAVATGVTFVGAAVFGTLAVDSAAQFNNTVGDCVGPLSRAWDGIFSDSSQALDAANAPDRQTPPGRDLPAFTNPERAECDQLSRAGVKEQSVDLDSGSDTSVSATEDPSLLRQFICGVLNGTFRAVGTMPRTFRNLDTALAGLIYDHGKRNNATVDARLQGNSLRFFASDFALLIRREAGSTVVRVPAITTAQLLCSSPGFIPSRNISPKDLGTLPSLPLLLSITELGTGVSVNVK